MKKIIALFIISFSLITLINCSKKEKEDPETVYATLTTTNSSDTSQNVTLSLKSVATCTKDSNSSLVTVRLGSSGATAPFFALSIKGYNSTTPGTYTCTQASDNTGSTVGSDLYQSCAMQVGIYSDASGSTLNQYSMYRPVSGIGGFTYAGTCTVTLTDASPTIKGTVSCTRMVQSYLNGSVRNPTDSNLYVDLSGNFYCTFGSTTASELSEDAPLELQDDSL